MEPKTLRQVIDDMPKHDAGDMGTPAQYVVAFIHGDSLHVLPFVSAREAEDVFRYRVRAGDTVTITNLLTYHAFTVDGRREE